MNAAIGRNRELLDRRCIQRINPVPTTSGDVPADGVAQYAGDRNVGHVGGSRSAPIGHRANLLRIRWLRQNRDGVGVRRTCHRSLEGEGPVRGNREAVAAVVLQNQTCAAQPGDRASNGGRYRIRCAGHAHRCDIRRGRSIPAGDHARLRWIRRLRFHSHGIRAAYFSVKGEWHRSRSRDRQRVRRVVRQH